MVGIELSAAEIKVRLLEGRYDWTACRPNSMWSSQIQGLQTSTIIPRIPLDLVGLEGPTCTHYKSVLQVKGPKARNTKSSICLSDNPNKFVDSLDWALHFFYFIIRVSFSKQFLHFWNSSVNFTAIKVVEVPELWRPLMTSFPMAFIARPVLSGYAWTQWSTLFPSFIPSANSLRGYSFHTTFRSLA
jgi:hypothetical protein